LNNFTALATAIGDGNDKAIAGYKIQEGVSSWYQLGSKTEQLLH
jgi:hypothetical protein